jgi:hypothetical protein
MTPTLGLLLALALEAPVDLSKFNPASGIRIERVGTALRADWTADAAKRCAAIFSLDPARPLLEALEVGGTVVAQGVRPVFTITTGSRTESPNERYIFFDKPASRPTKTHETIFDFKAVRVESAETRASIHFSNLTAGPFAGELVVRLYSGSPFLHVEATLKNEDKLLAYIYDFQLEGEWQGAAWKSNKTDQWMRAALDGEPRPVGVRNRVIFGETPSGSVAVFPPPHAFFFPRDHTVNFKFAQIGKNRFGLRQDPAGGPGHQGAFIPWFDAPAGQTQRMSAFVLASTEKPEAALDRVKRYTNGDVFKPMDGRFTFTSHWHVRLTMNELNGKPAGPEVAQVFKAMNVNLVHLAEFHGDGDPADPGPQRLPQLKAMFEVCRKYSDDKILFIPGEEANAQLNMPAPKGTHPGHWLYLFPKPVYLTLVRSNDVPFVEDIAPYGKVYHAGSEADMVEILRREKALAWTAHPRIKASFACPDVYKEKDWYKDDLWLGGAWKAMPADLSEPRLGVRVLDLLDDMNTWGQRKQVPGEVDTFELDSTHELYGHMNINYLKLAKKPTTDDWSSVLGALRRGDFFTTTGEVLIHSFDAKNGKVNAELEWTFPLSQILMASWDGHQVTRQTIQVNDAPEFGRRKFEWPLEGSPKWVRLEAWDMAGNGAFTQSLWLD